MKFKLLGEAIIFDTTILGSHTRQKKLTQKMATQKPVQKKINTRPRKLNTNNPRYITTHLTDYTGRKHATWKEYTRAQARPHSRKVEQDNRERKARLAALEQKHLRELEEDKIFNSSHPMEFHLSGRSQLWDQIKAEMDLGA